MKQFYLTGIFVAAILLTACNDEEKFVPTPHEGVLKATVESNSPSTRAGFTDNTDATFYWSKGDQIGVTTSNSQEPTSNSLKLFTALTLEESSVGQSSGSFGGTMTGTPQGYAVYPFDEAHTISGTTLTYNFKPGYSYSKVDADYTTTNQGEGNSFNPPMWGKITGGNVGLKHLGAVFCIKIDKLPTAGNMTLTLTSDKKINGKYEVDLSQIELPQIVAVAAQGEEERTVSITFSNTTANTSGVFYIPTPVGQHTLRLKVLDSSNTPLINAALGTYTIERRLLKKLELTSGSINAGEQSTVETAAKVKDELSKVDYVAVKSVSNENSKVEIPAATTGNSPKTIAFESITSSALTVEDVAGEGNNSVENLTLTFASNESVTTTPNLTLNTPNTTSTLQGVGAGINLGTVTASTAENTLIVDKGVSITKLIVQKGNVRVNNGAKIETLQNNTQGTIYVIKEEGVQLPTLPTGCVEISATEYELQKAVKKGGTIDLAADAILSTPLVIEKDVVLNLNGHTIQPIAGKLTKVLNTSDAMLLVRRGATLTINGEGTIDSETNENIGATIKLTDIADETGDYKNQPARLIVNGGTIKSKYFAISGNGTRDNTELEIKGGTISSLEDYAVYSPQTGTTTISGGTISGAAGAIALQDGALTISGTAELLSKGTAAYDDTEGDGTRGLKNAAVCIPARYGACTVNISGGTFTAEGNSTTMDITYNQAPTNYTKTISITQGTFSDLSALPYLADNAKIDVALNRDCTIPQLNLDGKKEVTVELNKKTLTLSSDSHSNIAAKATFKNGNIVMSHANHMIDGLSGKLWFEGVNISGSNYAVRVQGPHATLDVINSTINANYFSLSTNANLEPDGSLTYGDNATINLKNSHFNGGETGFMNNVPATVTIDNCTFTGNHQAAFLRGGDYTISNSTFTLNAELAIDHGENLHMKTWGAGNKAAFAGITIGNYINGAYQYRTTVDMKKVTVKVEGSNASSFPAMHVCANSAADKGVTITYDNDCNFTSPYTPAIEYGTTNITVNGGTATINCSPKTTN